jgi:thiol-disulfide isomerase/thioredoxin
MKRWLLVAVAALASAAAQAALEPFTAKSLAAIRAQNAGRPFVLALWSLHCEPCRHEMAQWGSLAKRHPDVRIVLVSTDVAGDRALVEKFLAQHDLAGVQTWLFADAFEERVRFSIDRSWRGELPRTYLFDARHKAQSRSGPADLEWIEAWIEGLR